MRRFKKRSHLGQHAISEVWDVTHRNKLGFQKNPKGPPPFIISKSLSFLSLRYGADFRRSRFVSIYESSRFLNLKRGTHVSFPCSYYMPPRLVVTSSHVETCNIICTLGRYLVFWSLVVKPKLSVYQLVNCGTLYIFTLICFEAVKFKNRCYSYLWMKLFKRNFRLCETQFQNKHTANIKITIMIR